MQCYFEYEILASAWDGTANEPWTPLMRAHRRCCTGTDPDLRRKSEVAARVENRLVWDWCYRHLCWDQISESPRLTGIMGKQWDGLCGGQRTSESRGSSGLLKGQAEDRVCLAPCGREISLGRCYGIEAEVYLAKGCHFLVCRVSFSLVHISGNKYFCWMCCEITF